MEIYWFLLGLFTEADVTKYGITMLAAARVVWESLINSEITIGFYQTNLFVGSFSDLHTTDLVRLETVVHSVAPGEDLKKVLS